MEDYSSKAREIANGYLSGEVHHSSLGHAARGLLDEPSSIEKVQQLEKVCCSLVRHGLYHYVKRKGIVSKTKMKYFPALGTYRERETEICISDVPSRLLDVYALLPDFSSMVSAFALEIRKQGLINEIEAVTNDASESTAEDI